MKKSVFVLAALAAVVAVTVTTASGANGRSALAGSVPPWASASALKGAPAPTDSVGFRVYLGWRDQAGAEALCLAVRMVPRPPASPPHGSYDHAKSPARQAATGAGDDVGVGAGVGAGVGDDVRTEVGVGLDTVPPVPGPGVTPRLRTTAMTAPAATAAAKPPKAPALISSRFRLGTRARSSAAVAGRASGEYPRSRGPGSRRARSIRSRFIGSSPSRPRSSRAASRGRG